MQLPLGYLHNKRGPGNLLVVVNSPEVVVARLASGDSIVVADLEDRAVKHASLSRRTPEGRSLWTVAPPGGSGDSFLSGTLEGSDVVARSWAGYEVRVSVDSGHVLYRTFNK